MPRQKHGRHACRRACLLPPLTMTHPPPLSPQAAVGHRTGHRSLKCRRRRCLQMHTHTRVRALYISLTMHIPCVSLERGILSRRYEHSLQPPCTPAPRRPSIETTQPHPRTTKRAVANRIPRHGFGSEGGCASAVRTSKYTHTGESTQTQTHTHTNMCMYASV